MNSAEESVGAVEVSLPPLYCTSPTVGSQLGTARYYTMKSVYRGKDEQRQRAMGLQKPHADMVRPDKREILDFGLAAVDMEAVRQVPPSEVCVRSHMDFAKRHQFYFRMKGLEFNQLHSVHRNKEERLWDQLVKSKENVNTSRRHRKLNFDRFRLPPIAETKSGKMSQDYPCLANSFVSKERKSWEQKVTDRIRERTLTANRPRPKQRPLGRPQGRLVSSRRLRQILDGPQVLFAGNFYNNG